MADPVTPNLGLTLPVPHETPWYAAVNGNWDIIDTFAGEVPYLSGAANQTIVQATGTYFSVNDLVLYGTVPALRFGTAAAVWDSSLTRTGAGQFTMDSGSVGNALGVLALASVDASAGFKYAGAAPLGHVLVGDGTHYIDSATLPAGLAYYQTVQSAGSSEAQQPNLNFLAPLSVANNPGNTSTDISLANTAVTPGSYTSANITVGADGRVTAAANGTPFNTQSGSFTVTSVSIGQFSTLTLTHTLSAAITTGQVVAINTLSSPGTNLTLFAWATGTTLTVVVSNCAGLSSTLNAITIYYKIF